MGGVLFSDMPTNFGSSNVADKMCIQLLHTNSWSRSCFEEGMLQEGAPSGSIVALPPPKAKSVRGLGST